MEKNKKFKIVALGCRTNQYEAQGFRDQLQSLGWQAAKEGETAELCIVNTCTVTESADSSSRAEVRRLSRTHPQAKLFVTGCSAETKKESLSRIAGVTSVVPNAQKENLLKMALPEEDLPEFRIQHFEAHTRAFVKVQDGCNSFCTYCVIPYVRGRSRSRSMATIVEEVKGLIQNGFKEVVLTGINIGDFDGGDGSVKLKDLVEAVDKVEGLERLRVSSIDPDEVDDPFIEAILSGKNTAPSLHIVLQSGSNFVLKRMNRKYTQQIFLETLDRLREASPDFTFTTDIIFGFPGETEEDFQKTLDIVREAQFLHVHAFPYSPRPRTRAALYPERVPHAVMQERKARLFQEIEQAAYRERERFLGRKMMVLTETERDGESFGHTANFLPVRLPGILLPKNTLVEVKLIKNEPQGLVGTCEL